MQVPSAYGVPLHFEDYLASRQARGEPAGTRCDGCHRDDLACWRTHEGVPITYCEACLRYAHGYDEAQAQAIRALLMGAVTATLHSDVSAALIRATVHDAIEKDVEEEWRSVAELLSKSARADVGHRRVTSPREGSKLRPA